MCAYIYVCEDGLFWLVAISLCACVRVDIENDGLGNHL